jgi:dCMP deaminase
MSVDTRISREEWAMTMAVATSYRSTCARRRVGCVLLNSKGHVLATGYNGVATGLPHCNEIQRIPVYHDDPEVYETSDTWLFAGKHTAKQVLEIGDLQCVGFRDVKPNLCSGANSPSGSNLDGCQAIHAEQNAMLQCRDTQSIQVCYATTSPCMTCTKLLLNTSCEKIIFLEEYASSHSAAKDLWQKSGRVIEQFQGRIWTPQGLTERSQG